MTALHTTVRLPGWRQRRGWRPMLGGLVRGVLGLSTLAVGLSAVAVLTIAPAAAAAGTLVATGTTSPGGTVTMGTHLWIADHALGFCRVDPSATAPSGNFVNQNTCNLSANSPGQPTYDPATNFVYVPDNSAKGRGVWRLTFNPASQTVGSAVLLNTTGLSGNRPTATALGPDGNLYVGLIRSPNIVRITSPATGTGTSAASIGTAAERKGPSAMTFLGPDLYLAEGGSVTVIHNAATCSSTSPCTAEATSVVATGPTAIASNGKDTLYIADTDNVLRFTTTAACAEGIQDNYSSAGTLPDGTLSPYKFTTALSLDANGNLSVGDDLSGGAQILQGRLFKVAAGSAPDVAGACGVPAAAPPPPPGEVVGTLFAAGTTSPGGSVTMGTHLWIADHALGFCRVDPSATAPGGNFVNQNACNLSANSPGQPTYDPGTNFVYVPDNSAKSQGVWRLTFNPTSQTVGSPVLLANGAGGLAGNRATASALAPDGSLYVGFLRNGSIVRVSNPSGGASATVQTVAKTSDGRGVSSIAFAGPDLYLAEGGVVSVIANPAACTGGCTAQATSITATGPTAIASRGTDTLYVADTPGSVSKILRFTISTSTEVVVGSGGTLPDGTTSPFLFATALSLDPAGSLYVGDDQSGGAQILQGRIWKIATP